MKKSDLAETLTEKLKPFAPLFKMFIRLAGREGNLGDMAETQFRIKELKLNLGSEVVVLTNIVGREGAITFSHYSDEYGVWLNGEVFQYMV